MLQIIYLLYSSLFWYSAHGFSLVPALKGKFDSISGTIANKIKPDYLSSTELTLHPAVKNTFEIANSFNSAPSCESIASAALAFSCGSLDTSNGNLIEHVKTVYAARLAVCELLNANIEIPRQCFAFVPHPDSYKKVEMKGFLKGGRLANANLLYPKYDSETEAHTDACITALHETPQYWTSYSNNKQTTLSICQAMHAGEQTDNIVRMFHETVTIFSDMMDEQKDIAAKISVAASLVQEYQDALATNHTAIINSTRDAFNSVLSQIVGTNTELSRDVDTTRDSLAAVYANIENMADLLPRLYSATGGLVAIVDGIDDSLRRSTSSAKQLDTSIANSTDMVDRINNDLTSMQAHIDEAKSFFHWIISIRSSMPSTEMFWKIFRLAMELFYIIIINVFVGVYAFRTLKIHGTCSNSAVYGATLAISLVNAGFISATGAFLIAVQGQVTIFWFFGIVVASAMTSASCVGVIVAMILHTATAEKDSQIGD
ncbi:hypothetical protein MBLNU457_4472t1 [Dothideomycetes sp. NU457]